MIELVEGNNELNVQLVPVSAGEFVYASELSVVVTNWPTDADVQWTISVENVGETGLFEMVVWQRDFEPPPCAPDCHMGRWIVVGEVSEVIIAGKTSIFSGYAARSARIQSQLMVKSLAGTLLNPEYPPEDQGWY